MSLVGGIGDRGLLMLWLHRLAANARATLATLRRPSRSQIPWPSWPHIALAFTVAVVAIAVVMVFFDLPLLRAGQRVPLVVNMAFNEFTDFGRSGWFLIPTGVVLIALALLDAPELPRWTRGVLASFAVRVGFVFAAVAAPGLFVTVVKRLIGRARPFIAGDDIWVSVPFGWQSAYASFPSGHTTTAFSALVAIGAVCPPARALMWTYALLIAVSRIIISAHHPSDVLAGAIVGALGALLVRDWFAARRLGFAVSSDGGVRAMPGPSWRRIVQAVSRALRSGRRPND